MPGVVLGGFIGWLEGFVARGARSARSGVGRIKLELGGNPHPPVGFNLFGGHLWVDFPDVFSVNNPYNFRLHKFKSL